MKVLLVFLITHAAAEPFVGQLFKDKIEAIKNFIDPSESEENRREYLKNIVDHVFTNDRNNRRTKAFQWGRNVHYNDGLFQDNPDTYLSAPGIINYHGYPCETHTVISQGYVLNLHRIPISKEGALSSKTILLQHGLFGSSVDWLLNGPGKALAYVLSDAGYDVWMSNVRGNKYSRQHQWLKTDSKSYWDFSWHESALYDLPAIIDYIMWWKGEGTRITYIGHSMGTTILMAMLTLRPEYNNILASGIALAPEIFLTDLKPSHKHYAFVFSKIGAMEKLSMSYEFNLHTSNLVKIARYFGLDSTDPYIIKNIIFYTCGANEEQFNESLMPMLVANAGTGTSWKTLAHYAQEVQSGGEFKQFDYRLRNYWIYGSKSPPNYDLNRVTLPLTLFWAKNDLLSSETDVRLLYDRLPYKPEMYLVPDPKFSHMDYLWSIDADTLINRKILQVLNEVHNYGL